MQKIYNEHFDETYYKEKLDNGLEAVIFHKPEYISSFVGIGTKFGALNLKQISQGQEYHFNPGVAHFLEHKLFESKDKDLFDLFSGLGANVNAFTSYRETVYHFNTTSEDIKEPLELLLDFVQKLEINEQSVEKEKDIIIQEVNANKQDVDYRLIEEINKSLFFNYPLKYDIGGDEETIKKINEKELRDAYDINYHPTNMVLFISSPFDPNELIKIIKDNQNKKAFKKTNIAQTIYDKENDEVKRKEYSFKMDISKAKHAYAIKLKPNFKDPLDCFYKQFCMNAYLKLYFSSLNPDYQKWMDKGIINNYFEFEVEFDMHSAAIIFFMENDDDNIKDFIDEQLKKDYLNQERLEQLIKDHIGVYYRILNDIYSFSNDYLRCYLHGYDFLDSINIIKNIKIDDLKEVYNSFDYQNYALVHIYPKGK